MIRRPARSRGGGLVVALLMVIVALVASAPAQALVTPASTAPPGQKLALVLPLRARPAALARFAQSVTDPRSSSYRSYEPIAWLSQHFGASARTRALVMRLLRDEGASDVRIDATGLFADATLTVGQAQRLFSTSLSARRLGHARFTAPATAVKLPAALQGLVTGVLGLDTQAAYSDSGLGASTASCGGGSGGTGIGGAGNCPSTPSSGYAGPNGTPAGCSAGLTPNGFAPNQYLTAYQYEPLQAAGAKGQGESVALIEIDGFKLADIDTFAQCFALNVPPIQSYGVGLRHLLAPGGEATLDLEVLAAAAPRLKSIDVYEAKPDAVHVLQALTAPLQVRGYKPNVISVSLGLCESDTLAAVGRAGLQTAEAALEEAAAAGISVLAASGDSGSAGCLGTPTGSTAPVPELAVIYPASSPWVTAVGGTNLELSSQNELENQVVWNDGSVRPGLAGGGGFSTLFSRPAYQAGVIGEDQRAVPDLALLADVAPGYDVYCTATADCGGRGWLTFGGTSAATPLLAGGFALIDQLLRERDLQPLGLANPLIYKLAITPPASGSIVYDVTDGSNDVGSFIQASGDPLGCCSATTGFDEASGWGGIDLSLFAADAELAQPPIGTVSLALRARQRPVAAGGVAVRLRCTRACDLTVRIKVAIPHQPVFTDYSNLLELRPRSPMTVEIGFTAAQQRRLDRALARHQQPAAAVTAALVDASGNIERQTPTTTLAISS